MPYPAPYPRGTWRPNVPHEFYAMHRDEIVQKLLDFGYSQGAAESEADAFLEYRDGPTSSQQEGARNDSVSEKEPSNRFADALARALGRKGETDADEHGTDTSIEATQMDKTVTDSPVDKGILDRIGDRLERAFGRREGK
jgi:hypothetical protein